ncbi:hypothetical protein TNCT_141621 [Trichonephila clavata]|uniref:Uncharacterized protein n=1 Tax=Trichonephila clavata TaxID=2740835 RepID=A0A8X6LRE0_TRICU|nr:hypothetical protein TNCT_141621 [Trichonephila clavata]
MFLFHSFLEKSVIEDDLSFIEVWSQSFYTLYNLDKDSGPEIIASTRSSSDHMESEEIAPVSILEWNKDERCGDSKCRNKENHIKDSINIKATPKTARTLKNTLTMPRKHAKKPTCVKAEHRNS